MKAHIGESVKALSTKRLWGLLLAFFGVFLFCVSSHAMPSDPFVAIHVSELTKALESKPAATTTPTGPDTTGFEWWVTAWRYSVAHESLIEALRSDGTPFEIITDADIMQGRLFHADGSLRYPIVFSLSNEAIDDREIEQLKNYVFSGGFLFVGSSSFTRQPDGKTRGDFAIASEMGLHMRNSSLQNWYQNISFAKVLENRLVSHIPSGILTWRMPLSNDQISWGISPQHVIHGSHYVWGVVAAGADVLASANGGPLLATRQYGMGRFIYHGAMQPLIGHGGHDSAMYAYVIYRRAIEWAFEESNTPIIKLSPWRYQQDAAFIVRHDFESSPWKINSIEASAQFEYSQGVMGDYYFCTGTLRENMSSREASIESLRRAVSLYNATIGSHNGGLTNPVNTSLTPSQYDYWHWGPDEAIDTAPTGYADGKAYALASLLSSFEDIEGWLNALDNGRPGCGLRGDCPRTWASPYFNSTREDSYGILEELSAVSMGEQKVSPFPHWTLSYRTPERRFSHVSLPASDWYVGSTVAQASDYHTMESLHAGIDFYYDLGAFINFYSHERSDNGGIAQEYVTYSVMKPRIWATNAVGLYDWWRQRSGVAVTPGLSSNGNITVAKALVRGSADPDTAVEIVIPGWSDLRSQEVKVLVNGSLAGAADYRFVSNGVKVRVGNTQANVEVQYPGPSIWKQRDWSGGAGQEVWADHGRYSDCAGIDTSAAGRIHLSSTGGDILAADDFSRQPGAGLLPWIASVGSWAVTDGMVVRSSQPSGYGYIYTGAQWTDYAVEARVQFPAGAYGGGIGGRVDPASGTHYGAWIYPGSNVLRLIKFRTWTSWGGTAMASVNLPNAGTGWHALKMAFEGNRIKVYYDGTKMIDVVDNNFDSRAPYAAGAISIDSYTTSTFSGPAGMIADDVTVSTIKKFAGSGSLTSSAFYGGEGALWQEVSWASTAAAGTSVCIRSRAADQPYNLGGVAWSACYDASGSSVVNGNGSWIQYRIDLTSNDSEVTPELYTVGIVYLPGTITPSASPTAQDDVYAMYEDTTLTTAAPGVLGNDIGAGSARLYAILSSRPAHGTLALNTDGSFVYMPTAEFSGTDSFTYLASDGITSSTPATATISVTAVNDPPVPVDDAYSTIEDTTLTIAVPGVLANDRDPEGTALSALLGSGPTHGSIGFNTNGSFVYVPVTGYCGVDSFTYRASDGVTSSTPATVTISVTAVNDPPIAVDDAYSTIEDTTLTIAAPGVLANDRDIDSSVLSAELVSGPAHGALSLGSSGSFVYTPIVGFSGIDSFTYRASDGAASSGIATVTITVRSGGVVVFSDDFTRHPIPPPVPFTWVMPASSSTGNRGTFNTNWGYLHSGTTNIAGYGYAYVNALTLADGSVETDIRFSQTGLYGGGIFGRLNPSTGQRYAAWIYPEGSGGIPSGYGPAVIKLIKFYNWGAWSGPLGMQTVSIPTVGRNWHHLKLSFVGNRIMVYYDRSDIPVIDAVDNNTGGYPPYTGGSFGVDFYATANAFGPMYNNYAVLDATGTLVHSEDFGPDSDPLSPWLTGLGTWTVADGTLLRSGQPSGYAHVFAGSQWTDYAVKGRVQFPAGTFAGGLGGRVDASTGAHYGAWVYPGSNVLRLIKFRNWTSWSGTPLRQVSLPSVGTGWHVLKMVFVGNRIQVYYDYVLMIDVVDENFDSRPPYLNGYISIDSSTSSTYAGQYGITADDVTVQLMTGL